ncbi:MAG: branched-chain amino acid ABC transporter substrate-binding protein [Hyphomicrobium sp.]|uniref:branched-chain amino acid ABC transporter substrate-binding protein n=1 Tax=Hyphomicrobium sp. TaxID=82 RepID=UPI0013274459|nr:branched-chain amino acid ABC transporter substrate-binding protein [Hyphomicrobium sp.]KAB2940312.1 MAG: branched-chain amino acid ABC transporter substrate-binding protein [Hyphomicrobium sp.]MBZ0211128.1 branched-chain amino acid ABC transporter substrate-binding protein [Hyphomicrobium sp.]MCZ7596097.1 branched-chain amino acid ABC transporter substrate-binding protein [Hyphomicrobium sp.]
MKSAATLAALALAFAALFAGCDSGPEKLKMGVAGPMTGTDAAFGAQLKNGVEQAVADINAAGGINGQQIELFVGDDAADPRQGVSVANNFLGEGVHFVVGHFNSGVSMPASEVYVDNGILMITPASTNPMVTDRKLWNVFRTCGRDDQQGAVAGKYIADNLKDKKVAVVHDKTTYGKGLADETKKAMNNLGVTEVLYEGVSAGEKDFTALVSKLKNAGVEVLYWGGVHTAGGLVLRQMRDQGVGALFMSGDGIASDEFAAIAGPGAEGTLMTFGPDPQKRPEAKEIIEKFEAREYKPEAYTLYSYAAVQILKQAIEATQSTDPKTVAAYMRTGVTFNTVIGDIAFDEKGDIKQVAYVMYTWLKQPDGRLTYVQN